MSQRPGARYAIEFRGAGHGKKVLRLEERRWPRPGRRRANSTGPHFLKGKFWSRLMRRRRQGEESRPEKCRRRHHPGRAGFYPIVDRGKNGGEATAEAAKEIRLRKRAVHDGKNFRNRISQKRPRSDEHSKKAEALGGRRRLRPRKSKRTVWRRLSRALI